MMTPVRQNRAIRKMAKILFGGLVQGYDAIERRRYGHWLRDHSPDDAALVCQKEESVKFGYRPLISIVVPLYNTPGDFFSAMVDSVRAQTYEHWELVLVDDASTDSSIRRLVLEYAKQDRRIKYMFLKKNHHIAGATNQAIRHSTGEFVSLLDHDDILQPDALFEVVRALNQNDYDFIYTDEDKIEAGDHRAQPFFKPDWNPDFLRSVNYITHFVTIRRSILEECGLENTHYNGAQDWELFLRIARSIPAQKIHHVPKVLYSWRVHDESTAKAIETKPYVVDAQRQAIQDDLHARGYTSFELDRDSHYPGQWQLEFVAEAGRTVSIVVLGVSEGTLKRSDSNLGLYGDCEFVALPQNVSYKELLSVASGEYIVLTSLTDINSERFVGQLLGDASRADIGFVLARCEDDVMMANLGSIVGKDQHSLLTKVGRRSVAKHLYTTTRYNIDTIHGGTVMIDRKKLQSIGDVLAGTFDIRKASAAMKHIGCRNLYNPYVEVVK